MRNLLIAAAVLLTSSAHALEQNALTELLVKERAELDLPGLRAAVRLPDGRVVSSAVGYANVKDEEALDDTIGMPGGSTGKMFVAALTMLLVEDGVLALDDLVSEHLAGEPWLEDLPNVDSIRVKHLLSHTSGLADYPQSMRYQAASVWRALRRGSIRFDVDELVGFAAARRAAFAPGEGFQYTDAGYLVLGRVIEAASGSDYYELLRDRILEPRALRDVRPADTSVIPDIATGYNRGAPNLRKDGRMKFDPSSEWTGGGLVTTPTMLVGFLADLANGQIVDAASLERMLARARPEPDAESFYGLGLFVDGPRNAFGHGGMWPGYRTDTTHFRARGLTIAVQANTDKGFDTEGLMDRIAELAD